MPISYNRLPIRDGGSTEVNDCFPSSDIVDFDGINDVQNPKNWSLKKKAFTTLLYSLSTFSSTWASAAYSPVNSQIAHEFGVSREVAMLGTSLLLLGFGFGPLVWAPLTEIYGRKWPTVIPCLISALFSFGTATAENIETVLLTRFLSGLFGAAPLVSTGGVLGDIWNANHRGHAIAGYSLAVAGGPIFGPVVGGALVVNGMLWRWTEYITGTLQISVVVVNCIFISESYPPRILVMKAQKLRIDTGHWAFHAQFEENDAAPAELYHKFGIRPLRLLFTPICGLVASYASFIYAVYYASLASFPILFQDDRKWDPFIGSLPFLALLFGILLGSATNITSQHYFYNRRLKETHQGIHCPEDRLLPMMIGSLSFPVGLLTLGWSSHPETHWIIPVCGAVLVGFSYYTIFQSAINYLIDTFETWGASAIAANTFLRSILAAAFPALTLPMYKRMGPGLASSIFAGIALLMIPIPFAFFRWGKCLRSRGRYSSASDRAQDVNS